MVVTMRVSVFVVLVVVGVVVDVVRGDFDEALSRQRRFSTQNCQMTPDNNWDRVIERNQGVKIVCNLDSPVQTCIWSHYETQNDGMTSRDPDIVCSGGPSDTGRTCDTQSRISYQTTTTQCGIQISNTQPSDTGKWKLTAMRLTSSQSPESTQKDFELFTFNQTKVRLTDSRDQEINTHETTYNYNTKEEKWETGKGDYENVEFRCQALGGRPQPKFLWYIENNNNDPLINGEGISISETFLPSSDRGNYIRNLESRITFKVDDRLLSRLSKYSINTNPSNGLISFELRCDPQQSMIQSTEIRSVRINIKRSYDDGNMKAGTIGLIVGVVIAVILVVVAIALLVFAKSSGRWCFADDEEAYRNPKEAKPRSAAAGGQTGGHSAQVYRDQGVNKTEARPRGQPSGPLRRSSSSSNDQPTDNKSSKEVKGEWISDSNTKPIIKKSYDSGRSSNSPAPSSVSSHSNLGGGGSAPPPRPYKSPDLQYANLDLSRSFMVDPRNRVLPSSQHPNPPAPQHPPQQQHQPTAYATIVSNSKIV